MQSDMNLNDIAKLMEMTEHLPEAVARERKVLAIDFKDDTLTLARPESEFTDYDRKCVEFILSRSVNWRSFPVQEIERVMDYAYGTVSEITDCSWKFKFECPKTWDELEVTSDNMVRQCASCSKPVFLCSKDEEIVQHAKAGDCVCIVTKFGMATGDVILQEFDEGVAIDFSDCTDSDSENAD